MDSALAAILGRQGDNGGPFWSRHDGDIHAPAGFSTIDVLGVLGDLGGRVDDESEIAAAAQFVLDRQTEDGAFRYSVKSSKLPCFAGRITAALCRVGVDPGDDRLGRQAGLGRIGWTRRVRFAYGTGLSGRCRMARTP